MRRSLGFYQGLLGFELIEAYAQYARLKSPKGNSTVAIHKSRGDKPPSTDRPVVMYFESSRLRSLCNSLKKEGVKFDQMPKLMPWGWTHAYLKDPDGHQISLYRAGRKRFQKSPV